MPKHQPDPLADRIERLIRGLKEYRDVAKATGGLPVWHTMGGSFVLMPSGKVVSCSWEYEVEPADTFETRTTLLFASEWFPSLADLKPERPSDALDCPTCKGDREFFKRKLVEAGDITATEARGLSEPSPIICDKCGGLGWIERTPSPSNRSLPRRLDPHRQGEAARLIRSTRPGTSSWGAGAASAVVSRWTSRRTCSRTTQIHTAT